MTATRGFSAHDTRFDDAQLTARVQVEHDPFVRRREAEQFPRADAGRLHRFLQAPAGVADEVRDAGVLEVPAAGEERRAGDDDLAAGQDLELLPPFAVSSRRLARERAGVGGEEEPARAFDAGDAL